MISKVLTVGILVILLVSCKSGVDVSPADKDSIADTDIYEVQDMAAETKSDVDVSDISDPDNEVPDIQFDGNIKNDENSVDIDDSSADIDDSSSDIDDSSADIDDSSVQDIDESSDKGVIFSDEYPDEDYAIVIESDCEMSDDCVFDTSWIFPEENWESWAYMKVVGEIGGIGGSACGESGYKVKNIKDPKEKDKIYITNWTGDRVSVKSINETIVDYYYSDSGHPKSRFRQYMYRSIVLRLSFSADLIPYMKESGARETDFGPLVSLEQGFIHENEIFSGTQVPYSRYCTIGIPKFKNDLPVGSMYGCFEDNVDGSAGEDLKMMFRIEIEDDRDKIIEYTNTRSDGSVAVRGDEDFKPYCFCSYDEKKRRLSCYNYDGVEEYYTYHTFIWTP